MKSLEQFINESSTKRGCFYTSVEGSEADKLYDKFSHREITVDELIKKLIKIGGDQSGDDAEAISDNEKNLGKSKDGKYFVTYGQSDGTFNVWTPCEQANESLVTEARSKSLSLKYEQALMLRDFLRNANGENFYGFGTTDDKENIRQVFKKLDDMVEDWR